MREVFDDAQRAKLVDQVAGSLLGGVRAPVLERAFDYWKSIDADVGRRIEEKVRAGAVARNRPKAWGSAKQSDVPLVPHSGRWQSARFNTR